MNKYFGILSVIAAFCVFVEGVQLSGLMRTVAAKVHVDSVMRAEQTRGTDVLSSLMKEVEDAVTDCAHVQTQHRSKGADASEACLSLIRVFAVEQHVAQVGVIEMSAFMKLLHILGGLGAGAATVAMAKIIAFIVGLLLLVVLTSCLVFREECQKNFAYARQLADQAFGMMMSAIRALEKFAQPHMIYIEKEVKKQFSKQIIWVQQQLKKVPVEQLINYFRKQQERLLREFTSTRNLQPQSKLLPQVQPLPGGKPGQGGNGGRPTKTFVPPERERGTHRATASRSGDSLRYPTKEEYEKLTQTNRQCAKDLMVLLAMMGTLEKESQKVKDESADKGLKNYLQGVSDVINDAHNKAHELRVFLSKEITNPKNHLTRNELKFNQQLIGKLPPTKKPQTMLNKAKSIKEANNWFANYQKYIANIRKHVEANVASKKDAIKWFAIEGRLITESAFFVYFDQFIIAATEALVFFERNNYENMKNSVLDMHRNTLEEAQKLVDDIINAINNNSSELDKLCTYVAGARDQIKVSMASDQKKMFMPELPNSSFFPVRYETVHPMVQYLSGLSLFGIGLIYSFFISLSYELAGDYSRTISRELKQKLKKFTESVKKLKNHFEKKK